MDVKVGRQILTWGTGDLLFVNDLFPKDWRAFFIGRDLEYLKAPADAMKVSLFGDIANLDLVYMPRFNPSRFISGRRISYFNTTLGRRAGQDAIIETDLPEIAPELTLGVQYYVELMQDYGAYKRTLPGGSNAADRDRHVVTVRLTKQLLNQNLTLGMFTYYSPTDADAYMRPNIRYKIDDHWTVEVGGNVFVGKDDHTFFGQFERNSNIYASLRCAF
ncbi:MAG: hypothetical protein ISS69_17490 [Phycisphaerae bacterium]|nr:hypothetical protein [Phycisphaerae bacterium]